MDIPKGFRIARAAAANSSARIKVGAAIFKSGRCLSVASNKRANKSIVGDSVKHHAEMRALQFLMNKTDIESGGCVLYVYRHANNRPALAKPCKRCMIKIRESGIKRVFYTENNDVIFSSEDIDHA